MFKIKDTTPFEKKLTKSGKLKKVHEIKAKNEEPEKKRRKRDDSSSMESALDKEFSKVKKKDPDAFVQKRSTNLRERKTPKSFGKVYSHEKDDENIAYLKDCYRDKLLEISKKKALIDAQRLAKYEEK